MTDPVSPVARSPVREAWCAQCGERRSAHDNRLCVRCEADRLNLTAVTAANEPLATHLARIDAIIRAPITPATETDLPTRSNRDQC